MERLNRRDLFKAALGAVGAMVVGKADAKTEVTQVERPIWEYGLLPVKHRYSLDWMDDQLSTPGPQPIRADEVWRDSFHATTETTFFPLYSMPRCDDPPVFWLQDTFATCTKHTAGPDGEVITNDRQPDITLNGHQPYLVMNAIDGWEEGEGFDGS